MKMQYALITMINGNFKIEVETNDLQQVTVNFHQKCASLWNAKDVLQARVAIIGQTLGVVSQGGHSYIEYIEHSAEQKEEQKKEASEK
jgi:hypothetical protein